MPHTFTQSYGSPQWVEVNVNRALAGGTVNWQVNNGAVQTAPLSEYQGGTKYGKTGVYYHRLRGQVTGFDAGDQVRVWFTAGGLSSNAFTFGAVNKTAGDVLVLAAEDYSGNSSVTGAGPRPGPEYLDYYRDALQRLGVKYDVYDIDAQNRTAPDYFGVLSHYKAVVWYTGDDLYVREPGQPGGTGTAKVFSDTVLAVRDYINDGGKVLVTGQQALAGAWGNFAYNPLGTDHALLLQRQRHRPGRGGQRAARPVGAVPAGVERLHPVLAGRATSRSSPRRATTWRTSCSTAPAACSGRRRSASTGPTRPTTRRR